MIDAFLDTLDALIAEPSFDAPTVARVFDVELSADPRVLFGGETLCAAFERGPLAEVVVRTEHSAVACTLRDGERFPRSRLDARWVPLSASPPPTQRSSTAPPFNATLEQMEAWMRAHHVDYRLDGVAVRAHLDGETVVAIDLRRAPLTGA
jgi:hypothetical protein